MTSPPDSEGKLRISSGLEPYLWILTSSLTFATMGALSRSLSQDGRVDWRLVGFVRAGLMLAFSLPLGLATGERLPFPGPPTLWVRSIGGSLGMLCTFFTLSKLPVSDASTLFNMVPVWVALLSWPVLKEKPGLKVWVAVVVSLGGVSLLTQPHFHQGRPEAVLVGLLSSIFTSVVVLGLNRLSHLDPRAIVMHFSVVSTTLLGVVFFASGAPFPAPLLLDGKTFLSLLAVGLTGTIGQLALTRAFALGEPSRVAVVGLSQLIFGAAYDGLFFHRTFSVSAVLGMLLIAGASAWLLSGGKRKEPPLKQYP